jgi:hypothetical protein
MTPARASHKVSAISAHCGSVGAAATTMVTSLAVLFGVTEDPTTSTVFVTVPLQHGSTVNVIGEADPPGAMILVLEQRTFSG